MRGADSRESGANTLEFALSRCYITRMMAGWEWMRRIIGPVLD
jgi:hypothetical protein